MNEKGKRFSISGNYPSLYVEQNFAGRAEALDHLEWLPPSPEVDAFRASLEAVDERLFTRLRPMARDHLRSLIDTYVPPASDPGYTTLDVFLQKLLPGGPLPEPALPLEPEMVPYQKTPAHLILHIIEYLRPTDVFIDLGSGLGEAVILVNLLTRRPATGIEIDPALCAHAHRRAEALRLDAVTFINADARMADLSTGTVFFMYSPFRGALLRTVLRKLPHPCRLIAYGPCTEEVRREDCLRLVMECDDISLFESTYLKNQ